MSGKISPQEEFVILVNDKNQEVGMAEKLRAHQDNLLHRAFSVFVFRNPVNEPQSIELLLQQRALSKYHSPGLWTNTCCSHPRLGEDIISAGKRRLAEEMGIECDLRDVGWFHYNAHFDNGLSEHEIDHVLVGFASATTEIPFNPQEVHAYRWVKIPELKIELEKNPRLYTQWLAEALEIALQLS